MSVKVGVRVRPFNKRQQQLGCQKCIEMDGSTTHIIDGDGNQKSFVYDYSFWSHDKFTVDTDGINVAIDDKYADQRKVFDEIGSSILTNAWEGYNCCLFAYGQTGSGKSYSMLGYGQNKGVIPIVCEEIFKKIEANKEPNKSFEVTVSMMEIYNESLRDLLTKKQTSDLKICEHKKLGVYVQGLHKSHVTCYKEIQKKIQQGSNCRSMAATLMNESSSRSHTIVSINFVQKLEISKAQMNMKYSVIHLVDLAGSQSVGKTGVSSKDRLRQTAKINQSLSTLGRVIEILAENTGKTDKSHVPYRDSKLTFILRNALGGNSQTTMICAISPADDNYEQTLSTLRYASRAKKIQNKAIINESDVDKLIRQLREENQMLKKMLKDAKWNKTIINQENVTNIQYINQIRDSMGIEATEEQLLLENQEDLEPIKQITGQGLENMSQSIIDKEKPEFNENEPYITNISEDELLSFRIKYSCKNLIVGTRAGQPKPDIVLAILGILPRHARIWIEQETVFIEPAQQGAGEYIFVNGENISQKSRLYNLDRVIFGSGCSFLVRIKDGKPRKEVEEKDIDYQFAISQMNVPGSNKSVIEESEMRRQILEEIEAEYENTKRENQEKLKQEMEEQERIYLMKLQAIQTAKDSEASNLRKELQAKQQQAKILEEEKTKAAQQVQKYMQLQTELQKEKQEKQAYQQTVSILQQKIEKVKQLEQQLQVVAVKEEQMKEQIRQQEEKVRKQLEIKTIICTNENILNEYKLEMSKKAKNTKELRDLFVKKQKIQLQKQLVALVPMIERFNLIAKQMGKHVESGLSVEYRYISEAEITEVLKTAAYKGKFQITVHIINRDQRRGYYWDVNTFRNRFDLALDYFQTYISDPNDPTFQDKETDPYWDPQDFTIVGSAFVSLESLFYGLSYSGRVNFIKHSKKVGSVDVQIYPSNSSGQENSLNKKQSISIQSPRDLFEKNMTFSMSFGQIFLKKRYQKYLIEYELLQDNYRTFKFHTQEYTEEDLSYKILHTLKELSENSILFFTEKPLVLTLKAIQEPLPIGRQQPLTQRSGLPSLMESPSTNFDEDPSPIKQISEFNVVQVPSLMSSVKSSGEKGFVFENADVLEKIDREYNMKKASMLERKKQKEREWARKSNKKIKSAKSMSIKDKECNIY